MIIKPICPKCGNEITINIKSIDTLKAKITRLEKENKDLRAALSLRGCGTSNKNDAYAAFLKGLGL